MRCKNREKYVLKKIKTQDNIYIIRQFSYAHEIALISLFSGKKKYKMWQYSFSLSKNTLNPNMKQQNIYIYIYKIFIYLCPMRNLQSPAKFTNSMFIHFLLLNNFHILFQATKSHAHRKF